MTKPILLEQNELDNFLKRLEEMHQQQLEKIKVQTVEKPLTRKGAAKYLGCSVDTIDKKWSHLKHQPEGTVPYWLASELHAYIVSK